MPHVLDLSLRDMSVVAMALGHLSIMMRTAREAPNAAKAAERLPRAWSELMSTLLMAKVKPEDATFTEAEIDGEEKRVISFDDSHILQVERVLAQVAAGLLQTRAESCDCDMCQVARGLTAVNIKLEQKYYDQQERVYRKIKDNWTPDREALSEDIAKWVKESGRGFMDREEPQKDDEGQSDG